MFFLKGKTYKEADKKHRVGVIIPAKNEETVIGDLITCLKAQNYPTELVDIFVVADNCTDRTAEVARAAGATVFERFDDDPARARASYANKFGFERILKDYDNYDFFLRLDADNFVHPDFITKMNDAFASGAKLARGYSNAKNLTQNVISCISGLWYIRDSRFTCQARSSLGLGQNLQGSGMMISAEIIRKNGGWVNMGYTEDTDFTLSELLKGNKGEYVKDAIIYEDQPTTLKDTFRRNMRLGRGLNHTFWKYGTKCLGKFFTTGKLTYLDMFLTELFIPIAVVMCTWLPLFYVYALTYNGLMEWAEFETILITMAYSLSFAFILPFILQALFAYLLDRKKIGAPFRKVLPGILLFPLFMVVYAAGIVLGVFFRPKWKSISRSSNVKLSDIKTLNVAPPAGDDRLEEE